MNKKILALIVVIIIIVSAVAAIELIQPAASPNARSINIGLVAPISKSPVGTDMQRAAELAVNEINDAGGVYVSSWHTHVNITLTPVDTIDDSPGNAVTPVTQAVTSEKVDMLIGGYGSAGTLADEVVAIDNKVPFIITGASNQLVTLRGPQGNYGGLGATAANSITDADGMSYVFHYCTTTYDYTKTIVDFFATQMKPMVAADRNFSLAIFYRNDAFGQGVEQAAKYWIQNESLPINIVADRNYDPTTVNYQTDLTVVQAAHPDAVLVCGQPGQNATDNSAGLERRRIKDSLHSNRKQPRPNLLLAFGKQRQREWATFGIKNGPIHDTLILNSSASLFSEVLSQIRCLPWNDGC